ncbi:MAG: PilZ domain-containing protein [Sphingomonas sp.]|nr:MAG: PilZ domain-containing protein [Sphingomonas sp.]
MDVSEEERFAHLRAAPRDSMFLLAMIRRPGGADIPVKVRNLSSGGMMAECATSFSRDEAVEADLRGIGAVSGRIAWTAGGKVGIAFDREIDPKLARKPVTGNPQPQLVKASKSMWRPGLR